MYAEVCNAQEFVTFSVQKPMENSIVTCGEKKKSKGQNRTERRKIIKEKEKQVQKKGEENKTINASFMVQEVTTKEVVSIDAGTSEEVFEEDLVTDEPNPRPRLRVKN